MAKRDPMTSVDRGHSTRHRGKLHQSKLDAFVAWAESQGFQREPTKGPQFHEALRLRYPGHRPLIFYYAGNEHLTAYGPGLALVRKWLRERKGKTNGEREA
jgi:hypothetical protein